MWSRSLSLTLGGDESYYRDGSCGVVLLQRRVVWSRSLSLTLGGDESYYRDGSCGVEVFL